MTSNSDKLCYYRHATKNSSGCPPQRIPYPFEVKYVGYALVFVKGINLFTQPDVST